MKKLLFFAFLATAAGSVFAAAAIEQVIVRQQWPWSTDVKVEYKISGVNPAAPVTLGVQAFNGGVPLDQAKLMSAISGDIYGIGDGIGELIIDPVKAFGQEQIALANFKVKLTVTEETRMADVFYRIYDMTDKNASPFPYVDVTRADLLNGKYGAIETDFSKLGTNFKTGLDDVLIWTGVTNYPGAKTTKLVLRKIPAKDVTWTRGQSGGNIGTENASNPHDCTLRHDYFIGVFELTQEQYRRLGRNAYTGSYFKGDANPVETAKFSAFRASVTNNNAVNFAGELTLDFPTEAQWEFACRAGTTAELYTGQWLSSTAAEPISWNSNNSGSKTHEVGCKMPNAFGLYDMIGNVYEACSDNWSDTKPEGYIDGKPVIDPTGSPTPDENNRLVTRGGYYGVNNFFNTCAARNKHSGQWEACGFRVCGLAD